MASLQKYITSMKKNIAPMARNLDSKKLSLFPVHATYGSVQEKAKTVVYVTMLYILLVTYWDSWGGFTNVKYL